MQTETQSSIYASNGYTYKEIRDLQLVIRTFTSGMLGAHYTLCAVHGTIRVWDAKPLRYPCVTEPTGAAGKYC